MTTRQVLYRRVIWGGLTVFAFFIVIRLVDKFFFGEVNSHLIDKLCSGAFVVYLFSLYRTPCLSCGAHLGWRVFLWWLPGQTIVDLNLARCPHCGTNINRDASQP